MKFVIGTLAIIMCVINVLSLIIIWFNVKLNKNIEGYKLWILGNVCNGLGILLLIMREFIYCRFITIIIGNELIILGEILIYIGIMNFIERKLNYKIITYSYLLFTILYIYLTYINNNLILRSIVFSFFISAYLLLSGFIVLKKKSYYIDKSNNFLGIVLLTEGFFFTIRGIIAMASNSFNSLSHTIILDISAFVISIIMSPLMLFGLIFMINQKLSTETRVAKERLQLIFDTTPDAVFITSLENGFIAEVNDKFVNITGFSKEEAIGEITTSLGLWNNPKERQRFASELKTNTQCENFEMVLRKRDNSLINALISARLMDLNGEPYIISVVRDISKQKKSEEEILYLSYHNQLTGLYNRRFYEEELKRLDTERNLPLTLIMGDVNGLKLVNDAFGHLAGDKLIKEVAEIFKKECSRDEIVARIGGDEFIILLPKTDSYEAQRIVQRINLSISNKKVDNMVLSVSFGWATKYEVNKEITKTYMEAEDHMYRNKLFESNSMKSKTIDLITKTLYEKNGVEKEHFERVSELCVKIGLALGLNSDEMNQLKISGLLHDIGKIGIDEKILNKSGKLNYDEWLDIKRHSEIGYQILRSTNEFSNIAEFILAHHERWDGKGYPKELKGEEIPLISRIITIADAYDAMTSKRSYKSVLSDEVALAELWKSAGTQFDPKLVNIFIEKVLEK